ncbi:polynucleotide kinase-phosphatase [Hymenobacter qilianensis]|uniref:Polynucleotide kinase-phosphatase n=2 Tax=Hymenobacter qilianensis TaxID=1385715 RepID=A0ACB5PVC6_9BACT|nr:polynucleotide kinase-phosphatase [Hymenobacter qilianensis]QNP51411.1 polynucleotide kinase-phosphatase [Hymenobacter qilianensis]GGF75433.1 polynucleotide kinase-phosphatase [Hymenobacter qilianensis]
MALTTLKLPELSLVLLMGTSGAGKSTFARRLFRATEIVSSDYCRALVADDENDQSATPDAFALLQYLVGVRLKRGLLTVVDATNVQPEARKVLVQLARDYHVLPTAIILDVPDRVAEDRNQNRPERRHMPRHVVPQQRQQLRRSLKTLKQEGFRHIFHLHGPEEINAVQVIQRDPLYSNRKHETGPFDIIGDVHGCYDELVQLLGKLGYAVEEEPVVDVRDLGVRVTRRAEVAGGRDAISCVSSLNDSLQNKSDQVIQPNNISNDETQNIASLQPYKGAAERRVIFLGDLVDRGPASPQVLRLVMRMVQDGLALCVPGNHDIKLLRHLGGKNVNVQHGFAETLEQLAAESDTFKSQVRQFLDGLVSHYVLDDGRLVVAHAGMREDMQGRGSGAVRAFALFGETTGEIDEFGLPVRYNWASEYRGRAMVVYGHTPVPEAEWLNNTIDIDTGCVFGGQLTALRYPERELVAVPAARVYCEPVRPLNYRALQLLEATQTDLSAQQQHDDLLDIRDVTGKQIIRPRLLPSVTIREENAIAALEVMSRFALNPKWLLYLPPTMSPTETSPLPDLLEHPAEAFDYFRRQGVERVVCEEKHMGSRVVVVLARDEDIARRRFGIVGEGPGKCYTRTGRNFFTDPTLEAAFLTRLQDALLGGNFWEKFQTDWLCLDAELLPWSAKAQELIKNQYAAVAAAADAALPLAEATLTQAATRGLDGVEALLARTSARHTAATHYAEAYRRYCWPVESLGDLRLAPFHLLATEGRTYFDKDHAWHMETLRALSLQDPGLLRATTYHVVNLQDPAAVEAATQWWTDLTEAGGEGMVVKPYDFIPATKKGILQPALKCRGREYLRIIYGPDYLLPGNLERLKERAVKAKRNLALREFALGVEGLERFVAGAPLREVHQCVFGVLALESEAVDPRL